MTSLLSSNGRNSAYFGIIRLKLSKHAYFEVRFHPMLSKYETSKNRFYEAITNELYWEDSKECSVVSPERSNTKRACVLVHKIVNEDICVALQAVAALGAAGPGAEIKCGALAENSTVFL